MNKEGSPRTRIDKPSAETDPRLALEAFREDLFRSFNVCFPACIYAYDRHTHTADVMPLVKQGYFNGIWNYRSQGIVKGVTVRNIQCGGFTIDVPVYVGDTGWVFASDRDTQLLKRSGALTNSVLEGDRPISVVEEEYQQDPHQPMLHEFSQGFFIPDNWGVWENYRYKDNNRVSLSGSLYIGSSIDTSDDRPQEKYQEGEEYEKKDSASIVLQKSGGASLSASSNVEDKKQSHVSVSADGVEMSSADRNNTIDFSLDSETGILVRQHDRLYGDNFEFSCNNKGCHFRILDTGKEFTITYKNGRLDMRVPDDINVDVGGKANFRCLRGMNITSDGDVNVNTLGDMRVSSSGNTFVNARGDARVVTAGSASVTAQDVHMVGAGMVNINSGGTVNIGAVNTTNVNGGKHVNIASGNSVSVAAGEGIRVEAKSDVNIVSKKGNVDIATYSNGGGVSLRTFGKNAPVSLKTHGDGSSIEFGSYGKNSKLNILGAGEGTTLNVHNNGGKVSVVGGDLSISGTKVKLEGTSECDIRGKVMINGSIVNPLVYPVDDGKYLCYWSWALDGSPKGSSGQYATSIPTK